MSPWLWSIWRLALARSSFNVVGGWRRLFWRIWWRMGSAQVAVPAVRTVEPFTVPEKLHWVYSNEKLPLCGASRREAWTVEFANVTCDKCRERGQPSVLQYFTNTR